MNKLEHLQDFQKALVGYTPSEVARKVLANATLVLCSGATASGRNTIIRDLVKTGKYYLVVSDTTRKPRDNDGKMEQDGVEYWFRTEQDMLADIKAGKFIEAEIIHQQQVSGQSIREIKKATDQNKVAITDADSGGVAIVKAAKPDTICIFFLPPDYDSWQARIAARGHMDPAEYQRRMDTAQKEIAFALDQDYYHFVINDKLEDAARAVQKIVSGDFDQHSEEYGRLVATQILARLQK